MPTPVSPKIEHADRAARDPCGQRVQVAHRALGDEVGALLRLVLATRSGVGACHQFVGITTVAGEARDADPQADAVLLDLGGKPTHRELDFFGAGIDEQDLVVARAVFANHIGEPHEVGDHVLQRFHRSVGRAGQPHDGERAALAHATCALLFESHLEVVVSPQPPRPQPRGLALDDQRGAADLQRLARCDRDDLACGEAFVAHARAVRAVEILDRQWRADRERGVDARDRRVVDQDLALR